MVSELVLVSDKLAHYQLGHSDLLQPLYSDLACSALLCSMQKDPKYLHLRISGTVALGLDLQKPYRKPVYRDYIEWFEYNQSVSGIATGNGNLLQQDRDSQASLYGFKRCN